jgi:hypothetical protein
MKRTIVLAWTACMLIGAGGCTRGIKEGMGIFQEGKGKYQLMGKPPELLMSFDSIEIGEFTVGFERTPQTLIPMMKPKLVEELLEKGQPVAQKGDKTLVIRGKVIYYESSAGGKEHVFGPLEEAVAIVELVDKKSGSTISRAACVGRTTASVNRGTDAKADGLAEAIAAWISTYRPVPE